MLKRLHYNSPVILTLAFLAFGAMLLGYLTAMKSTILLFSVYRGSLTDVFFYFRLFGHILGHADWEHFFSNFLLILILGPILEEKYGSRNMIFMIAITAFVTGVLNIVLFDSALLGASGIVFMLILLSSIVNFKRGRIPLTLILVAVLFIGKEIMNGFLISDNISQITHIVGGLCGGFFGFASGKSENREQRAG